MFRETPGRGFALTPLAALLRRDHPHSLRHVALLRGMPETYAAWGALLDTVRTGRPGFDQVFGRARFDHFQTHPEADAVFQAAMDDKTRAFADGVGGGHGRLLGAILQAWPGLHGVLFDQPAVVAGAGPVLDALGVCERVECVGGDILAAVPPAGAYLLCNILHDWDDARLLIVEMRLPDAPNAPAPAA